MLSKWRSKMTPMSQLTCKQRPSFPQEAESCLGCCSMYAAKQATRKHRTVCTCSDRIILQMQQGKSRVLLAYNASCLLQLASRVRCASEAVPIILCPTHWARPSIDHTSHDAMQGQHTITKSLPLICSHICHTVIAL